MPLEYVKIFKQAYEITKTYKFLWIFSLFLVVWNLLNIALFWNDRMEVVKMPDNRGVVGVIFLVLVWLIFLFFRAKAGLIIAIKAIIDKQETSFKKSFAVSRFFYSRILAVSLLVELGLFVLLMVLASPIMHLVAQKYFMKAVVLGSLASIIFIPVAVVAMLTNILAPLFIVIYDLKIQEALKKSFDLISQYWVQLVRFGFFLFLVELVVLGLSAIILGLLSQFVVLGHLSYHTRVAVSGFVAVFLGLLASIISFQQIAWTLVFLKLIRPQKIEEDNAVPVAEVVS